MTRKSVTGFWPKIGEVYAMRFVGRGSEQRGWRPGVVLQNNVGNKYSPNIIAIPLTSSLKKVGQPTHVVIRAEGTGLRRDSMALCENPECISKEYVGDYITTLPGDCMRDIAVASLLATSAIVFLDKGALLDTWEQANEMHTKN